MLNMVTGVVASLIANIISMVFRIEKKTRAKKAFERRARKFHSEISPYLLKVILPKMEPNIAKRLATYNVEGEQLTLPFVRLSTGKNLVLANALVTEKKVKVQNSKLINWMSDALGKTVVNNPTFTLNGISSNEDIIVGTSDYYSTLSTCDIHYLNLIRYFPLNRKRGLYFLYRNNKYTRSWLDTLRNAVVNQSFSHYHASIGCSVLTVLKTSDGKYKYVVKRNSRAKGSSAMERHVLPSFMLQPVSKRLTDQERELDLRINILREYGEELLGLPELEEAETVDVLLNHIDNQKFLKRLRLQLDSGKAILEITGFVIDIFRLRPEITCLLIINDDIYAKNIKTNWETADKSLDLIELFDSKAFIELMQDTKCPLCAPGLAALLNGREHAIEILAKHNYSTESYSASTP